VDDLWEQIRVIDTLNGRIDGIRILKSAEVDILADGSLDYPDDLLSELDYTVCSIHSRFGLGKAEQTERILRAMDNRYFNILGHATGRLLLKRPGYEIDMKRAIAQARQNGCFSRSIRARTGWTSRRTMRALPPWLGSKSPCQPTPTARANLALSDAGSIRRGGLAWKRRPSSTACH